MTQTKINSAMPWLLLCAGAVCSCVPVNQQPSVRAQGLDAIALEPPAVKRPEAVEVTTELEATAASQASADEKDEFGNRAGCEGGSIPLRRIDADWWTRAVGSGQPVKRYKAKDLLTRDETSRYPTLRDFMQKGPDGAGRGGKSSAAPAATAPAHKYSIVYQNVNNLDGNSSLNLWKPNVVTAWGEIFSLSKQWYVGGSGAATQTAEVGWQNDPAEYGDQRSRLFIYYTADNYTKTGCYNHDCAAFVQTSKTVTFGGGWANYSAVRGTQYESSSKFYLYQGNWWLSIQGQWAGYYPGTL